MTYPIYILKRFSMTIALVCLVGFSSSCIQDDYDEPRQEIEVSSQGKEKGSTTAGNLVATAILQENDLDMVFYPTGLLVPGRFSFVKPKMSEIETDNLLSLYPPPGPQDQFILGTIKGKDIKDFIFLQAESNYSAELQVAGLKYDIQFIGGKNTVNNVSLQNGKAIDDNKTYFVAISNVFYFSGNTAPGYKFGYGFNFNFRRTTQTFVSARTSLKNYLEKSDRTPEIISPRAIVKNHTFPPIGLKKIHEIQSDRHVTPLRGHIATVEGIVTASAITQRYPYAVDVYIEADEKDRDKNPRTSEGLHLRFADPETKFDLGDRIQVTGTIFEQRFSSGNEIDNGLTKTGLRHITQVKILEKNVKLPPPVLIGGYSGGRNIPNGVISSFNGNLNRKLTPLNLKDGIGFWESLESMRIKMDNPRVVGFAGGLDKFENRQPKKFLNLFLIPNGDRSVKNKSGSGGIVADTENNDLNPQMVQVWTHHLTSAITTDSVFEVGEQIMGSLEGIFSYEQNFFNSGGYTLLLPQQQETLVKHEKNKKSKIAKEKGLALSRLTPKDLIKSTDERPKTFLVPNKNQVSIATYNVENLSQQDKERLSAIAESIQVNLSCPDILSLVEIQDNNGISLRDNSNADKTLEDLISQISCEGTRQNRNEIVTYKSLNIDPLVHQEGGQPGGNIRVTMIYNSNKLKFKPIGSPHPLSETNIDSSTGTLSQNPGRVFPNDKAFRRTRKSLVAEFYFGQQRIIVIGNHFNSKLGDSSYWGAQQPPYLKSIKARTSMADKINDFVERLIQTDPNVAVAVVGDLNAHIAERALKALEGESLVNLMTYGNLVKKSDWYSTIFNGNSQALDYIFVNHKLLQHNPQLDVLHINSDYMGKHSDHDPILSMFTF